MPYRKPLQNPYNHRMSETPVKQRLHITFGKSGALKYTSNLDIAKVWERVLRRADLPILYSQGFNARPKMQLACPLPLGFTSECEIIDVALREAIALDGVAERIAAVSPTGLVIHAVNEAPIKQAALQALIRSGEYRIRFEDGIEREALQSRIDTLMSATAILKTKKKKDSKKTVSDIRPLIYDLHVDDAGDLIAHLAVGDFGNVRPDDVLEELGLEDQFYSIHRLKLHLLMEGQPT